ncbi:hypothetical protein D3C81_1465540 [compost metagenome]
MILFARPSGPALYTTSFLSVEDAVSFAEADASFVVVPVLEDAAPWEAELPPPQPAKAIPNVNASTNAVPFLQPYFL